jgi:hypothetical protein
LGLNQRLFGAKPTAPCGLRILAGFSATSKHLDVCRQTVHVSAVLILRDQSGGRPHQKCGNFRHGQDARATSAANFL